MQTIDPEVPLLTGQCKQDICACLGFDLERVLPIQAFLIGLMRNLLQEQHLTKVYALEFFALWIILDLYGVLSLLGFEVAPVIETRLEEFLRFRSLEKPPAH